MIIAIEGHVFRSTPITPEHQGHHCDACEAHFGKYPGLISFGKTMCGLVYAKSGGCSAYDRYWIEVKK